MGTCGHGESQSPKGDREPDSWQGKLSSGLWSRRSAIWYGSSGSGTGAGPEPVPAPEYLNLRPDGRDPGPENEIPVSGFPLS